MLYNLPENHLGGRVFFGFSDRPIIDPDAYFELVPTVKPLLAREDFAASTPGFYINYICPAHLKVRQTGLEIL
jgi:hypothetical protein